MSRKHFMFILTLLIDRGTIGALITES